MRRPLDRARSVDGGEDNAREDGRRMRAMTEALGLRTPAGGLLGLLLIIDAAFIAFYLTAEAVGIPRGPLFDLALDRGYGEIFQYIKIVWAGLLVATLWARSRSFVFAGWTVAFAYLFVDDAFQLHEHVGWAVRDAVPGQPGWAVHTGELAFLAAVGLVLLGVIAVGHTRATREERAVSAVLAGLTGLLVLVGLVLDAANHLVFTAPEFRVPFTVVEDGGELVVMSLIVTAAFAVAHCGHRPRLPGRPGGAKRPSEASRPPVPAEPAMAAAAARESASRR